MIEEKKIPKVNELARKNEHRRLVRKGLREFYWKHLLMSTFKR